MTFIISPPPAKLKTTAGPFPPQIGRNPQPRIPNFNPSSKPTIAISKRLPLVATACSPTNASAASAAARFNVAAAARNFKTEEIYNRGRKILMSDVVVERERKLFGGGRKWNTMDVSTAAVVVAMHLLALPAPLCFSWPAFWVAVSLYVVTGLFGITLSFHRHLSHRSFRLPKWLEYLFAYCGVHALQGNPIDWVSTHRYHHQFCDSERDPHSPLEGFWFSHMSWLFDTNSITERCGGKNNVGDLESQPFYRLMRATYVVHPIALGLLLYILGGFSFLVWGMVSATYSCSFRILFS
ncbi:Palmitoyl-monogalactosyldiacylglycerol delta-7 desaturase, chloroplastic [Linum grandiflorum]